MTPAIIIRSPLQNTISRKVCRQHLFITLISSCICFGGCSTSPTHLSTKIITPQATRNGTPFIEGQQDLSQLAWWKKMHDPILNQLLTNALAHNNQIMTAEAHTREAQAKLQAAQFAWVPTLNAAGSGFNGGGWNNDLTPKGILATSPALSHQGNLQFRGYYTGFVPSYSLNIMQNIHSDQLAKASLAMQHAVYDSTRLSIISQMSGAYFMLLGHKAQQQDQLQLIHDLNKSRQLEHQRFKDGASDLSSVTLIDKQISVATANLANIKNNVSQTENAIQVLLNHNPGPIKTRQSLNTLSIKGMVPENLPSSVLKNRPDIIIAKENLNMSKANLGIAYSQFFPAISLTGLLGSASADLSHLLSLSTNLWLTQVAGSMPLLNGAAYAQIREAKAGTQAAFYNYLQTIRSVFAEVDDSLTNHQQMNAAYQHQLNALNASQTNYFLAVERYKAGAKDYREVINAKINVDNAKQDLNMARMQQLDSLVQVYQSLAGGYHS